MQYIGLSLIGLAAILFIYEKSSREEEIERIEGKRVVRIVRKFIWLKTLYNHQYRKITVFMQTRNVVQIQRTDSNVWVDVSWAAAQ
jgi:hypothetical protein